jgi:outer membrane protein TolC
MFKYLLTLSLILFQQNAFAFNLQDAVNAAIENNQQLAAAKKNLEKEVLATSEAATEFLPNINLDFKRDKNSLTSLDDINSSQLKENSYYGYYKNNLKFNVEQELFNGFGTINKLSASNAQVKYAYENYYSTLNEIIFNVVSSYQQVISYRNVVNINDENIQMATKSLNSTKKAVKNGADTVSTLYLAEAELSRVKSEKDSFTIRLVEAEKNFKYLTGIDIPEEITPIDLNIYKSFDNFDDFIALVHQNNHSIKSKYHASKFKENMVKANISSLSPKVNAFYSSSRHSGFDSKHASLSDRNNNTIGLNVNVPIFFKGGAHYVAISKAKKDHQASKFDYEDTRAKVDADAQSSWKKYISAGSILKQSKKAEEKYFKSYEAFSTEHKLGSQTIVNVINSQREFNFAAIKRIQNEMEYKTNLFNLYKLIGNLPELMVVKKINNAGK